MKRNFRGFTLIECIVALAVLAVAALTMAQIYASVSHRNKTNHMINTSLANQMAYVEQYTDAETYPIYFKTDASGKSVPDTETKPPHEFLKSASGTKSPYVTIVSDYVPSGSVKGSSYSYAADVFILKIRDASDKDPDDAGYSGDAQTAYDLRYKYLTGHNNG